LTIISCFAGSLEALKNITANAINIAPKGYANTKVSGMYSSPRMFASGFDEKKHANPRINSRIAAMIKMIDATSSSFNLFFIPRAVGPHST